MLLTQYMERHKGSGNPTNARYMDNMWCDDGDRDAHWGPQVKLSFYIPLKISRENILEECTNTKFKEVKVRYPLLNKDLAWMYKLRFCRFHKSHKHNMDECVHLKDSIKNLINKWRSILYTQEKGWKFDYKKWVYPLLMWGGV